MCDRTIVDGSSRQRRFESFIPVADKERSAMVAQHHSIGDEVEHNGETLVVKDLQSDNGVLMYTFETPERKGNYSIGLCEWQLE